MDRCPFDGVASPSTLAEVTIIAKEVVRRYLRDGSILVCRVCNQDFVHFHQVLKRLSLSPEKRKDTLDLLWRREVPVGFLCCNCFNTIESETF